jgi:hypothetical protein
LPDQAGLGEVEPVKLADLESGQAQIGVYDVDARVWERGSLPPEEIAEAASRGTPMPRLRR